MGANSSNQLAINVCIVSIHAPVMGANSRLLSLHIINNVSIHAPVMGANTKVNYIDENASFNPRTRDGCE